MRDIALAAVLVYCIIRALKDPWFGILAWTMVSILNPHRYTWHLSNMPVAAALVIATLFGIVVTRGDKSLPITRETVILMLLMLWFCITLPFSFDMDGSIGLWKRAMKIDFMILVAMMALRTRAHIMALAWVLVISLGFYGMKGGIFTLLTGGHYHVWGPPDSYIEGNNELALALVAIIPIMRFLQLNASNRWLRRLLAAGMALSAVAALGTQSRGALLAIVAMALMMWWRSEKKFVSGLVLLAIGAAIIGFMPDMWSARMDTIGEYQNDASAMGRINAWWMAWNLASANFFGGGFSIYNADVFARYAPVPTDIHAAHSIYFQILGEHGFVGLGLYLLLWTLVWLSAGRLRREGKSQPETRWLSDLGAMCQVSLVGYAVGGAFLSLAYFDLPYNVLLLVVLGRRWMESKAWLFEANGALVAIAAVDGSRAQMKGPKSC